MSELYTRTPTKVDRDYYSIAPHNHPVGRDELQHHAVTDKNKAERIARNQRVEIRYYDDQEYDGQPVWLLASAWLDEKPFMVIRNGRDFITDTPVYQQAMAYLQSVTDCQKCLAMAEGKNL